MIDIQDPSPFARHHGNVPVVPATFNSEAGKPLESGNLRLAWEQLSCGPQTPFDFLSAGHLPSHRSTTLLPYETLSILLQ